jgi:hypothetical protein
VVLWLELLGHLVDFRLKIQKLKKGKKTFNFLVSVEFCIIKDSVPGGALVGATGPLGGFPPKVSKI